MNLFNLKIFCRVHLLPQVNQKMILILTASIMYWSLQQPTAESETASDESPAASVGSENETVISNGVSNLAIDDAASETTLTPEAENEKSSKKAENDEPSKNVENEEPSTNDEGIDIQDKE